MGDYKTVSRPDLKKSWMDRVYLFAVLKGMWITFRHMFRPKWTMRYPEEKWKVKAGYRGSPVLTWDHGTEREKCVACLLCMYVCPAEAIYIEPSESGASDPLERRPGVFDLDMTRCIYCGFCEEVCPKEAIVMSDEYELNEYRRENLVRHKDRLLELGMDWQKRTDWKPSVPTPGRTEGGAPS
jgi:NADH-quinone oxidoreductase subunit I